MKFLREIIRPACIFGCLLLSVSTVKAEDWLYTMKPGDTVWDLSHNMLKDWRYWKDVLRHNKIKDATTIRPGTRIAIPLYIVREEVSDARVDAVSGEVKVVLGSTGESIPLKPGVTLSTGDKVITAENSTALLSLEDGSIILLQEQSELEFTRLRKLGGRESLDARLQVRQGGLKMNANPSHYPDSSYEIRTVAANSAVRGTGFRIGVEGEASRTEVLEGLVSVGNALGQVDVPENFGTVARKDAAPEKPVALLPPPDLAGFPTLVRYLPQVVKLDSLPGAVTYHVQVAKDENFMQLVLDRVVKGAFMIDQVLPDGSYYVQIRGVDAKGLEGKNAVTTLKIDARPEAPMVRKPLPGKVLHAGDITFAWADVEDVDHYLFELADDEAFTTPRVQQQVDGTELTLPVAEGNWYFRLTSVTDAGRMGPPGHPVTMNVLPVPPVPEPKPPATEEGKLVLAWQDVAGVASYNVQVATDKDFQNLVFDETISEPMLKVAAPPSGFYYFRLRSVDAEGYQGSFGAPQRFEVKPESYWPLILFGVAAVLLAL